MHLAKGPNESNLKGEVFIPNPSVMTITMVCPSPPLNNNNNNNNKTSILTIMKRAT